MRKLLTASFGFAAALATTLFVAWPSLAAEPATATAGVPAARQATTAPSAAALAVLQNMEITADGGVNFFTTQHGKRMRSFAISPQGSVIAGGVSKGAEAPFTNDPPTIEPAEYDKAGAGGGRNWIHDFYLGRYVLGEGQPRLHTRGLIMWGRGDSPDVQLGRTGPDNNECPHTPRHDPPGTTNPDCPHTMYGPPTDTAPGTCLGKIAFVNWGEGEFQGDLAGIMARNDTVATKTKNPGSLHLMTAGPSVGSDEKTSAKAWRDNIDRLVIRSNGYVAIGDNFTSATERLHVQGNIRADGNVVATGDIVARGAKKFAIDHPTRPGKQLVHAAVEGPEAAVYYRGEGRLTRGRAVVDLPDYFEASTRPGGRTVMLTNVGGFDRLAVFPQTSSEALVEGGRFVVVAENSESTQRFTWEVKAVRADVPPLEVEQSGGVILNDELFTESKAR